MKTEATPRLVVGITLLSCLLIVSATVGIATHNQETTEEGFKAYSENPQTGEAQIPNPGETESVELYGVVSRMGEPDPTGRPYSVPAGVEFRADYVEVHTATGGECNTEDTRTAGIDRGNDESGLATDESAIPHLEETGTDYSVGPEDDPGPTAPDGYEHRERTFLDLYGEDDFSGDPLYLNTDGTEDEVVLALEDCTEMPTMEGWYRTWIYFQGTVTEVHDERHADDFEEGQEVEMWEPSLWYPVCECDEPRQVPMRIGPPPGESTPAPDGSQSFANGTLFVATGEIESDGTLVYNDESVPVDQVTSEGIQFSDGFLELTGPIYFGDMDGSDGMVEADGTVVTADGERYPPEDQGQTDPQETQTATSDSETRTTDEEDPGESTATEQTADGSDETDTSDDGDGSDDDDGSDDAVGDSADEVDTPPGDQAGFGAIAALAALLASLVALRARR